MKTSSRRLHTLLPALLCLTALWGCGGGTTGVGDSRTPVPTRDPVPGMSVTVATDKTTYHSGETIQITVTATNTSGVTHNLVYPATNPVLRWGYIIAQNGRIVTYEYWTGHNLVFDASVIDDKYAPGQTKQFSYVFPYYPVASSAPLTRSLAPGTYQVYARQADLTYDNNVVIRHTTPTPASAPVTITVI